MADSVQVDQAVDMDLEVLEDPTVDLDPMVKEASVDPVVMEALVHQVVDMDPAIKESVKADMNPDVVVDHGDLVKKDRLGTMTSGLEWKHNLR